jgi:type I restriction enzyme R subunit
VSFTEDHFEQAVLAVLREYDYNILHGGQIDRDYRNPLYMDELGEALLDINQGLPAVVIRETIRKLQNLDAGTLIQKNKVFTNWLQNGMEITFERDGKIVTRLVKLVDFAAPQKNRFTAINQWTVQGASGMVKRPDIVIFVNGLPLVVIELKSGSREEVSTTDAYRQLRNYMNAIPELFCYNGFCIISDLTYTRAGTISSDESWFMEWKTVDGSYEETAIATYDTLFRGMLGPDRLLNLLQYFTLIMRGSPEDIKILSAYHQYYAVKKAVETTIEATRSDGRAGVFWHTQGSGKSLSMVFYVKQLQDRLESPTFVVITDRNDLDSQLYTQFAACDDFLRQTPIQAESRKHLQELLDKRQAHGIFFSTMQKFEESSEPLSHRRDIIVIADEAHRSQYGLTERIKKDGTLVKGAARIIRDSLPRASYIGFTGTPISLKDRDTREVFGNYIDIYDMTQSVEDGATRPVFYENRVMNLGLREEVLEEIDRKYEELSFEASAENIERSKKQLGRMEAVLGAPETIETLCQDIVGHYEDNRAHYLTGKAMIVAYSRAVAMKIYEKILDLRPDWGEKVKVVMTGSNQDPEGWQALTGSKAYRQGLAAKFKDNDDPMKIAIVVDMWLTGFDVPSLATMYFYKPMAGHNLMQAIARVNRVFEDKEGGLVVDYIGIASALKEAMKDYTRRDQKNYGEMAIEKTAYPNFQEKLQICKELLHGFDYSQFARKDSTAKERADLIKDGANFVFGFSEEEQKLFIKEAAYMKQFKSLCQSILTEVERLESAFIEAIRVSVTRVRGAKKLNLKEINLAISTLLEQSIKSEGVINLFSDREEKFSIFDPDFLANVKAMKQKNLALELLRKLLDEQIVVFKGTNIVQSEKFSERMKEIMNSYRNGQITNAEVIEELIKMSRDIMEANRKGEDMGLAREEVAFYDALTRPEAIKDFYEDETLKEITRRLTGQLRKSRTVDWQQRQSARAGMRRMVKRLLDEYNYPPEGQEEAIDTVLKQCEHWVDSQEFF